MLCQCDPPRKLAGEEAGWAAGTNSTPTPAHTNILGFARHTRLQSAAHRSVRARTQHSTAQHTVNNKALEHSSVLSKRSRKGLSQLLKKCWVTPTSETTPAVLPYSQSFRTSQQSCRQISMKAGFQLASQSGAGSAAHKQRVMMHPGDEKRNQTGPNQRALLHRRAAARLTQATTLQDDSRSASVRPPSNLPPPPTGSKWTCTCAEHTQKKREQV